jgi:hypothetical protein
MPSQPHIPTYIPLDQAARHYGVSKKVLTQEIQAGKIQAVQLPSGDLLVAAENNGRDYQTKEEIIAKEFADLRGKPISASEASQKYSKIHSIPIRQPNFSNWASSGLIEVLGRGYRLQLDEADVAYCAKIYAQKYHKYGGQMSGVRIFDKNGNPYQLKYPEVAEQLRLERRQARGQVSEK